MNSGRIEDNRSALRRENRAFTLIELLVVFGILALLVSILLPSLSAARRQAQAVACRSNIRELLTANGYYRDEFEGVYCPGASDFKTNLERWHGARDDANEPFDSSRGPLVSYLGPDGGIRQCPSFPAEEIAIESGGFERGNGGYGYNNRFVGVQYVETATGVYEVTDDRAGAKASRIRRPAETIMFTDSAFAQSAMIEYSFAEPRFHPEFPAFRADPSIHFRHGVLANVGWCDGHVDAHKMTFTHYSGSYRVDPARFGIGWFGEADDNSLFDLK